MNRTRSVLETPLIRLTLFDHPRDEPHEDPPEESSDILSVNFVLHGSYGLAIGRESWRMTPDQVFVTRPGLSFCCHHEEESPTDVCLSVEYRADPAKVEADRPSGGVAPAAVLPSSNRLAFLRYKLTHLLAEAPARAAAEDTAAELWQSVTGPSTAAPRQPYRATQLRWYAERVEGARDAMRNACADDHSLADLARGVGMSPFHFARVFRELCGVAPHQYLLKVRLQRACRMLAEGASVAEVSQACGFRSVSYFSRFFRSRFGMPPSRFARGGDLARK